MNRTWLCPDVTNSAFDAGWVHMKETGIRLWRDTRLLDKSLWGAFFSALDGFAHPGEGHLNQNTLHVFTKIHGRWPGREFVKCWNTMHASSTGIINNENPPRPVIGAGTGALLKAGISLCFLRLSSEIRRLVKICKSRAYVPPKGPECP